MSIFTSKFFWNFLIKIQLTKSDPKRTKEIKVSPLVPIRVKYKTMFYDQDICPVFLSVGQIWTEFLVTDLFYFESDHYLAQKVVVVGQGWTQWDWSHFKVVLEILYFSPPYNVMFQMQLQKSFPEVHSGLCIKLNSPGDLFGFFWPKWLIITS